MEEAWNIPRVGASRRPQKSRCATALSDYFRRTMHEIWFYSRRTLSLKWRLIQTDVSQPPIRWTQLYLGHYSRHQRYEPSWPWSLVYHCEPPHQNTATLEIDHYLDNGTRSKCMEHTWTSDAYSIGEIICSPLWRRIISGCRHHQITFSTWDNATQSDHFWLQNAWPGPRWRACAQDVWQL